MLAVSDKGSRLRVHSYNLKTGHIAFFPLAVLEVELEASCMLGKLYQRPSPEATLRPFLRQKPNLASNLPTRRRLLQ